MIQPLANRVLVKPDPPPDVTDSGIVIPDNAHVSKDFDMSGTVIRIGTGPASAHRVREAMIARFHRLLDTADDQCCHDQGTIRSLRLDLNELAAQVMNLSEVQVGDHVAFPYTVGTVMVVDGERYLLMNEDQMVAILDREVAA